MRLCQILPQSIHPGDFVLRHENMTWERFASVLTIKSLLTIMNKNCTGLSGSSVYELSVCKKTFFPGADSERERRTQQLGWG